MFDKFSIASQSHPLDLKSFKLLLKELFTDYSERQESDAIQLFNLFDRDQDGLLNESEFKFMWSNWVEKFLRIRFGLMVVDMQNDFINGSLAIKNCPAKQDGADCVPVINQLIENIKFDKLIYTLDWHPDDHISFFKNVGNYQIESVNGCHQFDEHSVKMFDKVELKIDGKTVEQILWPVHCVQNSEGAQLHQDLIVPDDSLKVWKGTARNCDSYSAFFDNLKQNKTELDQLLKQNKIDVLFISGLAIDYCISGTIIDALNLDYSTILIKDACKVIHEKVSEQTRFKLKQKGCLFVNSNEVNDIVKMNVRLFEIGLQFAKKLSV